MDESGASLGFLGYRNSGTTLLYLKLWQVKTSVERCLVTLAHCMLGILTRRASQYWGEKVTRTAAVLSRFYADLNIDQR